MRIIHVIWDMSIGGAETMLVNIINEQVKSQSVELFIVNNDFTEILTRKISKKCCIKYINRNKGSRSILPILKLNIELLRFNPDIIHVHSAELHKLIFTQKPIVCTFHAPPLYLYPKINKLHKVFAISKSVKAKLKEKGVDSYIIENGIPTSSISFKNTIEQPSIYQIVQVSRLLSWNKGQDILLGALSILVNERGIKNFHMSFIGEGPSENELKQMTKDYGLEKYVTFLGSQDRDYIFEKLHNYDLFVQPSKFEGFGLTVAEAMAAKLPVIVSNIEGPMEIIKNGKYGMYFTSENPEDLADKIEIVLKGEYDYSKIEKAYSHVMERYDVSNTARHYIEEYHNITGK